MANSPTAILLATLGTAAATLGACGASGNSQAQPDASAIAKLPLVITADRSVPRPPYRFSAEDEALLDAVQRGAFEFLWHSGDPAKGVTTGMVPDRSSKPTVSIAGVGFQLSALPIGVERGWITRDQGRERAELILKSLASNPSNRKAGLFYHFLDHQNAGQPQHAYERVVSTIDSALFFAGVLTASQYFGGEVQRLGDGLFRDADWKFFVAIESPDPNAPGFITLGWKPTSIADPTGPGALLPYAWIDSGDEHRLVTFLAACAPEVDHRVDPALYYRLRRQVGEYADTGPFVWFPWSGALFTAFFAHCWIDYAGIGVDNPARMGVSNRTPVDWWENSRRTVHLHRVKALENPQRKPTLGENAWGLTASDIKGGYGVPGVFPTLTVLPGDQIGRDYVDAKVKDNYGDGTIAPYGAGCSVMFEPVAAIAAMRHYKSLKRPDGTPLVWDDPAKGGYGFRDAFNLGTGWAADEFLAIDQGPLLLAIENARTGLIWRLFHEHPWVKAGVERLEMPQPKVRTTSALP